MFVTRASARGYFLFLKTHVFKSLTKVEDFRFTADVGAHSKIGQQLEKGLFSCLPHEVHHFVDVVGLGHRDADEKRMALGPVASLGVAGQSVIAAAFRVLGSNKAILS
jgi:hypothetical protein